MKRSTVVVAAFFAMGISSAVAAQQQAASVTLRGRVVRASDGAPVAGADVWLVSSQLQVQTDRAGSFTFTGLAPGSQLLQIRHVGYQIHRDTLTLRSAADSTYRFTLTAGATELDTVRTVAGAQRHTSPMLRGFEERRRST